MAQIRLQEFDPARIVFQIFDPNPGQSQGLLSQKRIRVPSHKYLIAFKRHSSDNSPLKVDPQIILDEVQAVCRRACEGVGRKLLRNAKIGAFRGVKVAKSPFTSRQTEHPFRCYAVVSNRKLAVQCARKLGLCETSFTYSRNVQESRSSGLAFGGTGDLPFEVHHGT
ncbi:MAG: hypothetical protein BWY06_03269 [Candidatus Latescibacteria bacterium ADurb.Bin168]|nr:MAG: hypothetical protein BWY06_03269 [Candidatus Latescibacteria bacterium ADurb.Bin168]